MMKCIDVSCSGSPHISARSRDDWFANVTCHQRAPSQLAPCWCSSGWFCQHCRLSSKVRVLPDPQSRDPATIAMAWPRHFLGDIYSLWCPAGFLEAHSWISLCAGREQGLASQVDVTVYVPVSDEAMLSKGLSSPRQTCPTLGLDVELISWWASIHWEIHCHRGWNLLCLNGILPHQIILGRKSMFAWLASPESYVFSAGPCLYSSQLNSFYQFY